MKISIITVSYNSAKTIKDTIDSVLRQKYADYEYLVVDGASKDGTVDIIREYEPKFEGRMRWVSEPDRGIYDAMNKGIEMSTGDVVGILNSDDFFTDIEVLEKVAKEFEADPALEAIYGDVHFVKDEDLTKCTRYYSSSYFRPWLLRFGFMPAHPSFYVRKDVYEKYGLYDLQFRTSSDFEMMVRLFAKNKINAKYIPMDFVTMRAGGESTAGVEAKKKVNRDIASSLKKHGIYTCQAFQWVRYAWKVIELAYTKLKY
nr:glycosyltransferase [Bacteroidales bacterium]